MVRSADLWGMADNDVFSVYCHESGHAIAALARERPVNEMYIHPDNGFTSHGLADDAVYDDADRLFIVTPARGRKLAP